MRKSFDMIKGNRHYSKKPVFVLFFLLVNMTRVSKTVSGILPAKTLNSCQSVRGPRFFFSLVVRSNSTVQPIK